MKIIGKTSDGYIVEATADELAQAAGYRHAFEAPGWQRDHGSYSVGNFSIGTRFKPKETHKFLNDLRDNEQKVRDAAAQLNALAQMMTVALPTTVVPPPSKPSTEETAS